MLTFANLRLTSASSSDDNFAPRMFEGGRLKTLPIFSEYGLKDMLPLKLEEPDDGCLRPSRAATCRVSRVR